MQPTSPAFKQNQLRAGVSSAWVVTLRTAQPGGNVYWISDRPMVLPAGAAVFPFLIKHSGLSTSIDYISNKWTLNDVTITIQNWEIGKTASGDPIYIDSEVELFVDNNISIYKVKGEIESFNDTSTDSTIRVFAGYISEVVSVSADVIVLKAIARGSAMNQVIPITTMLPVFPNTPIDANDENKGSSEARNERIVVSPKVPIVYGDFTGSEPGNAGTGLARVEPSDSFKGINRPKLIVAGHPMKAITELWFKQPAVSGESTIGLQWFRTPTVNLSELINGINYGTVISGDRAYVKIFPVGSVRRVSDDGDDELQTYHLYDVNSDRNIQIPVNFENIYDHDDLTFAVQTDSRDFGEGDIDLPSELRMEAIVPLTFADLGDTHALDFTNDIGKMIGTATVGVLLDEATAGSADAALTFVSIYHNKYMSIGDMSKTIIAGGGITFGAWSTGTFDEITGLTWADIGSSTNLPADYGWHFSDRLRPHENTEGKIFHPLTLMIFSRATAAFEASFSDTILNNKNLLRIYGAYLQLEYEPVDISEFWCKCQGKKFGSWVDVAGRTALYNQGDLIEDPIYIIEDLIREHAPNIIILDMDTASFDNVQNTAVKARINFYSDNEMNIIAAITALSEQSTFVIGFTSNSIIRAIALNDTTPVTNKTILWHWIERGIKLSESQKVYNVLEIESRYLQERAKFADFDRIVNGTSKGTIGEREFKHFWSNISGTSVAHVGNHLVNNPTGIWANKKKIITFKLIDTFGIDLEIGDWIELDPTSVDPHQKFYGATWSGVQFLITTIKYDWTGTSIQAVELHL